MQALAISSPVPAGAPPPVSLAKSGAPGAVGASEDDRSFAQVVRDVLNRNAAASSGNSSGAPAVAPSKTAATPSAPTPAKSSAPVKRPAQATNIIAVATIANLVSLPQQSATLALPAPVVPPNVIVPLTLVVPSPGSSAPSDAEAGSPSASDNSTSDGSLPGVPVAVAPAANSKEDALLVPIATLVLPGPIAAQPAAAPAPAPASETPTKNVPASDSATGTAIATSESAKPSPPPISSTTNAPVLGSQPQARAPLPPVPDAVGATTNEQPISSLLPQIAKLKGEGTPARGQVLASLAVGPQTPATQNSQAPPADASGHAAPQFLGVRPAALTALPTDAKGLQPVVDVGRAIPSAQTSSSSPSTTSDHPGSQDGSSDRKESGRTDTASSGDSSTSTPAAHDASNFSQALAASASVKQDDSPAPSTPPAAVIAPSATPDRATSSAAPAPQAAPALLPPPPLPGADGISNRLVSDAKLLEAAGHSEMRIAMDTDKLGPVELRARMIGDEVGAAITVEKRDAHAALAVELPALQQALSDKQLRVEQVTLLHASLGSTAGDAGASARQDPRHAGQAAATPWSAASGGALQTFASTEQSGIFDSQGRLSVHA